MAIERRFSPTGAASSVTARTTRSGKSVISGYAAVFYNGTTKTQFELWPGMIERLDPHAFDGAVHRDDVRGLFNHDPSAVLGRLAAGTLKLTVDKVGLRYTIEPGDTTTAADVLEHLRRGDVSGSSFTFEVLDQVFLDEAGVGIRLIKDARLYDVGPVTFPAYEGTISQVV